MGEQGTSKAAPAVFLPGILMPAALRYAPLLRELGDAVQPLAKELEVYSQETPPPDYSIDLEVEGLSRAADTAGFERFHLFGHSGGGAVALAYAARFPERLLSLTVDEPASDFSDQDRQAVAEIIAATANQGMEAFVRMQLAEGVDPPAPPQGPPPPWMSNRPAGVAAFGEALARHRLDADAWRSFDRPVLFTLGSLSNPRWQDMRDRLAATFPSFHSELYEGLHHFTPCHQTDPARAAKALISLWGI